MLTLGIETSCDETACAVLEGKHTLRSSVVASSLRHHVRFGGVVPEIASRHHFVLLDRVLEEALRRARVRLKDIDLVAVTAGPGLIGALLVGVSFAKALAARLGVPLLGVNHLEAHLEANFIERERPAGPYVGLVVSGGHTVLVRYHRRRFRVLGETLDDAAGEAFDKVAKILGLGYPGGPEIDRLARRGNPHAVAFRAGVLAGSLDFSFSGIKTAVLYHVRRHGVSVKNRADLCASFERAVVDDLVRKTREACRRARVRALAAGGGVVANTLLRRRLEELAREQALDLYLSPFAYAIDNAAMIARAGAVRFREGRRSSLALGADPNLSWS